MKELQEFINGFGFGISTEELVNEAFCYMRMNGHKAYKVNSRHHGNYLEVDGRTYLFRKDRESGCWIAEEF